MTEHVRVDYIPGYEDPAWFAHRIDPDGNLPLHARDALAHRALQLHAAARARLHREHITALYDAAREISAELRAALAPEQLVEPLSAPPAVPAPVDLDAIFGGRPHAFEVPLAAARPHDHLCRPHDPPRPMTAALMIIKGPARRSGAKVVTSGERAARPPSSTPHDPPSLDRQSDGRRAKPGEGHA